MEVWFRSFSFLFMDDSTFFFPFAFHLFQGCRGKNSVGDFGGSKTMPAWEAMTFGIIPLALRVFFMSVAGLVFQVGLQTASRKAF